LRKKLIKSPNELISFFVVFMNYWACLHNPSDVENFWAGADSLLRLASATTTTSIERRPAKGGIWLIEGQASESRVEEMEPNNDVA
jgi:hypothetical protein